MPKSKNNDLDDIRKHVGEVNKEIKQNTSKNIIAYIRVSDDRQVGNYSPEIQSSIINRYAKAKGLKVVKEFVVEAESAKKGAKRPSIDLLFNYIKECEHEINSVVVFHSSRLTRDGAFGAKFLDRLIKFGIGFIDPNLTNDIFTDSGLIRQINAFYEAEHENATRKTFINTTIVEKLKQGKTMANTPIGYDRIVTGKGKNKKIRIVINEQGKLLKEAFMLKLNYNYSNVKIAEMMKVRGLEKSNSKQIGNAFKNVYYCGLIKDKRLIEFGGVVEGDHPKLITQYEYKIINNLAGARKRTIRKNDVDELPLRKHLICSKCHQGMTGYRASKRKDLFYYKCRTKGCRVNSNTQILHGLYNQLLEDVCFDQKNLNKINLTLIKVFRKANKENELRQKALREKINANEEEQLEAIRNMNSHMEDRLLFKKLIEKLENDLDNLNEQILDIRISSSKTEDNIEKALRFINDFPKIWSDSDLVIRLKLQQLVFPNGVVYNKSSNTLKPLKTNPIFDFIRDFDESKNFLDSSIYIDKKVENKDGVRTFENYLKNDVNTYEYKGFEGEVMEENEKKFQLVALPSEGSNNSCDILLTSLNELITFIELFEMIK